MNKKHYRKTFIFQIIKNTIVEVSEASTSDENTENVPEDTTIMVK